MSYGSLIAEAIASAIALAFGAGVVVGAFLMWLLPFLWRHLSLSVAWQ